MKFLILCLALISFSCNQQYENLLKEDYQAPSNSLGKQRKILFVILDGVNGKILKDVGAANISKMTESSFYSYDALLDIQNTVPDNLLGWSNLLTGKSPEVHGAKNGSLPDLVNNPTILSKAAASSVFASSQLFYDTFAQEANKAEFNADENQLVAKAKGALETGDDDLVVVEFNSAYQAAQNGGFLLENKNYTDAILNIDSYIGNLKDAISLRDTYSKEDWLIVISSNFGGEGTPSLDGNYFLDKTKNIFVMYYSPKFLAKELVAPANFNFIGQGLKFLYPATNPSLLTMNSTDKFSIEVPTNRIGSGTTYQFKVKMSGNHTSSSWPTIISKNPVTGTTNTGLDVLSSSGSGAIQVKTKNANTVNILNPFGDGNWHTVTIVYERTSASQIRVRTYQDGNIGGTATFNNSDNIIGGAHPLRIGRNNATVSSSGAPVSTFYDLKVYNAPLPQEYIMNSYCKTEIDINSPYIDNLKGYWLMNNIQGNQIPNLRNLADNSEKLNLSGATLPSLESINEYVGVFCPPLSAQVFFVVPFSYDNTFLMSNWLGLSPSYTKSLEGKGWSLLYKSNED